MAKRSEIQKALKVATKAKQPVLILGPPAIGKSQTVRQVAEESGMKFYDVRCSYLDAVDIRGLPVPNTSKQEVNWLAPEFWPKQDEKEPSILFLDEITNCPNSTQVGLLELSLDRRIGNYKLPENCVIVSAGNRVEDKAGSNKLITSLASRFLPIEFELDNDDWIEWAWDNDIDETIISFIRFRPDALYDFDPRSKELAFSSPRSLEKLSNIRKVGVPSEIEFTMYSGLIGKAIASEYTGFLRTYREMPDPAEVLLDPMGCEVPEKTNVLYALCGALARRAESANAEKVIMFAQRMPKEFEVLLVSDCIKQHGKEFTDNALFKKWACNNEL